MKIQKDSLLYRIVKEEEIKVNSFHTMQAHKNDLYRVVAEAQDGVIEAIEMPSKKFVLGVQWHPEKNFKTDMYSKRIMEFFIEEACSYKSLRDQYMNIC